MSKAVLVVDANILIRAVLGKKVNELILHFHDVVDFFAPDICIEDAKKYLPVLFEKRGLPIAPALEVLSALESLLNVVEKDIYRECEEEAEKRIKSRDFDDWPIIATALTLNCPVWTEDQDFFGIGISVWTTNRIHIFLEQATYKVKAHEHLVV